MKNLMIIAGLCLAIFLMACEDILDLCDGKGTLEVTNDSYNTPQRLRIDGVNYGTLDPGETKSVDLPAGYHNWQLVGADGYGGCGEATVIISECQTESFSCSY